MTTEKRMRWLAWEGCRNARDLGGYPTANGKMTHWGAIVRSDELSALTTAGRASVVAYGIRTIIDVRMLVELERAPNPFASPGNDGIAYTNLSFTDLNEPRPVFFVTLSDDYTFADEYLHRLDRFASRVATIMAAISQASKGGVLVHCAGGQDRTGLVCALLLDLVGVNPEMIAADYALSAEIRWPEDVDWLEHGPRSRDERERELERWAPRAHVMMKVLARLAARYGGAEGYLLHTGMTGEEVEHVRARLMTHG